MSETRIPADELKLSWAKLRKVLDKGKTVQREVALHGPPVDYAFFDEVDDAPAVYADDPADKQWTDEDMHIALALNRRGKSIAFDMIEHMIRFSTTTNDKRKPWEKANEYGEMPGDICCQRASSEFCYSHDKDNYPVEHSVLLKRIGYIFLCVVVIAINIWYLKHVWN